MNSEELKVNADLVASHIKDELRSSLSTAKPSQVSIESIKETMENYLDSMVSRNILKKPDIANDLKISHGEIPVYKVTFKPKQLNSIKFITSEEKTEITYVRGEPETELVDGGVLFQGCEVVCIKLDRYERDFGRIDVSYKYRPIIDTSFYSMNVVVKL